MSIGSAVTSRSMSSLPPQATRTTHRATVQTIGSRRSRSRTWNCRSWIKYSAAVAALSDEALKIRRIGLLGPCQGLHLPRRQPQNQRRIPAFHDVHRRKILLVRLEKIRIAQQVGFARALVGYRSEEHTSEL